MSAAQLSKGHFNLHVSSPNQYALLESEVSNSTRCNMNGSQLVPNKTISFTKPDYSKLAPWAKEHAQMHQCFCKRDRCYWHHPGDQFDEKKYEAKKEKPQVNKVSPELPDAGEENRRRALPSVQSECRSLNCDTAQRAEQGNRLISNQKNQNQRTKGSKKEPEKNLEVRHNFQRRNGGQRAPPGTAKWVAQQLAEEKPEQRIGILRLWVNTKRLAEATEETIKEINNLSDEDAETALNEMRRPKQFIRRQGSMQMNLSVQLQMLEDG